MFSCLDRAEGGHDGAAWSRWGFYSGGQACGGGGCHYCSRAPLGDSQAPIVNCFPDARLKKSNRRKVGFVNKNIHSCLSKLRGKFRETERSSIRSSNVHIYRIFDKTFVRFKLLCSSERCVSSKKRRWTFVFSGSIQCWAEETWLLQFLQFLVT